MSSNFSLGKVVATSGVSLLHHDNFDFAYFVQISLTRHIVCDWGDVCSEDWEMNNWAAHNGARILSSYSVPEHPDWKIWIITEADRSCTTILFPHEY